IESTTATIRELDAEINAVKEHIKQGIAMTDGELEVFLRKVVRRAKLNDQLIATRAGE
ncbi:unnamed protein product, partial [Rotaria sp. Silwood2]